VTTVGHADDAIECECCASRRRGGWRAVSCQRRVRSAGQGRLRLRLRSGCGESRREGRPEEANAAVAVRSAAVRRLNDLAHSQLGAIANQLATMRRLAGCVGRHDQRASCSSSDHTARPGADQSARCTEPFIDFPPTWVSEDSAWLRNRLRIVAIATTLLEVPQPFSIATTSFGSSTIILPPHTAVRHVAP